MVVAFIKYSMGDLLIWSEAHLTAISIIKEMYELFKVLKALIDCLLRIMHDSYLITKYWFITFVSGMYDMLT